ncbi:VOC family protein [Glutamicibacter uratoxydans]|uniref:VOC family protein n=1 Tax=Glutamicibacter uratoxydans TaxID=43667 RepID=UPI003D6F1C15
MIFINLPSSDLARTDKFYAALGFTKNETFSDANASSWMISETITVMLLHRDYFASFMAQGDAPTLDGKNREVLHALSADSREEVDQFVTRALAGGGSIYRESDEPFPGMYQAAVQDPDGHVWEIAWMSPEVMGEPS